jgi:hypothetical protein
MRIPATHQRGSYRLTTGSNVSRHARSVTSLIDRAEGILQIENEFREKNESILGAKRREMEQKRLACLTKCNAKLEKLKESNMKDELELERRYLKFEENLRNK